MFDDFQGFIKMMAHRPARSAGMSDE